MPATAKLYETDPYVQTFTATVLVCTPAGEQFAVQLDRTAFYPEGGGQPCDTGAGAWRRDHPHCQRSAAGWADGGRPH